MDLDERGGDCDLAVHLAVRWRPDGSVDRGPPNTAVTDAAAVERYQRRDSHGNGDLQRVLGFGLH